MSRFAEDRHIPPCARASDARGEEDNMRVLAIAFATSIRIVATGPCQAWAQSALITVGAGPASVEIARVLHATGRTMKYGAEFLYHVIWRAGAPMSAFIGGGMGVRTFRHRATCSFGACNEPGPYAVVLRDARVKHPYVSAITGMDVAIGHGVSVRAALRLDDFPSEVGAAQFSVELGYRVPIR